MYTFQVQKYTFRVQEHTSKYKTILSIYKSILSKYKSTPSKYKSIRSKYKSILSMYTFQEQKHTFRVQEFTSNHKTILSKYRVTFGTLGTESPEPGTFLIPRTSGSRNLVPRTGCVQTSGTEPKPSEPIEHRNFRNLFHATFWTRNNANPEPVPGTRVPSRNRPSSPRTHRNLYCAKTP